MIRCALVVSLLLAAGLAHAQSTRDEVCGNMSAVVRAIQEARLDRVKEQDVEATLLAQGQPWPEKFNKGIPTMTGWVYQQRMRDVRNKDLAAAWDEVCQENWQQLAELFE